MTTGATSLQKPAAQRSAAAAVLIPMMAPRRPVRLKATQGTGKEGERRQ